jgi:phospholipid/cholesterol/gamma-HCH transport system substrate-binding protein
MRGNQPRGLSPFQAGAILIVALVIVTYLGFTKSIPFRHHFQVKADFKTASTLRLGSWVRIAGVNVGKVTGIDFLRPGRAGVQVTMRLEKMGRPIHKDATIAIRPNVFLEGNQFLDVHPGTPTAPLVRDGDTIPDSQTTEPVQLDQILTALQADTRRNLQRLLPELSTALYGPGGIAYNRAIQYWLPAFRGSAVVNEATLGEAPHDLSGYLAAQGRFAAALDRNPPALKNLITNFNRTAAAFASEQTALENTISELPRTLRAARPALAALNTSFPPLRRLAHDLRPATRSTGPMIDAALPFITQVRLLVQPSELQGLSSDLRLLTPNLARLNARTPALLRQQRLASSCQNEVILPWSQKHVGDPVFHNTGKVYQESVKFLPGLGGESRVGDANGQWVRVLAGNGIFSYVLNFGDAKRVGIGNAPLGGVIPPKTDMPRIRYDVPCETQEAPNLDAKLTQPPKLFEIPRFANLQFLTSILPNMVGALQLEAIAAGENGKLGMAQKLVTKAMKIQSAYGGKLGDMPNLFTPDEKGVDDEIIHNKPLRRALEDILAGQKPSKNAKDGKNGKGGKGKNDKNDGQGDLQGGGSADVGQGGSP